MCGRTLGGGPGVPGPGAGRRARGRPERTPTARDPRRAPQAPPLRRGSAGPFSVQRRRRGSGARGRCGSSPDAVHGAGRPRRRRSQAPTSPAARRVGRRKQAYDYSPAAGRRSGHGARGWAGVAARARVSRPPAARGRVYASSPRTRPRLQCSCACRLASRATEAPPGAGARAPVSRDATPPVTVSSRGGRPCVGPAPGPTPLGGNQDLSFTVCQTLSYL